MGIKGTVRRSTDGDFIHANVDIDLIITEEVNKFSYLLMFVTDLETEVCVEIMEIKHWPSKGPL